MQRVPVVLPRCSQDEIRDHFEAADQEIRSGNFNGAVRIADRLILKEQVGLTKPEVRRLEQGRTVLVERRMDRAKSRKA